MSDKPDSSADTFKKKLQIDEICDRYELEWQRGQIPALDHWVSDCDPMILDELVKSLLAIDQDYRSKKGEPWSETEYLSRYPMLGDAISHSFRTSSHKKLDGQDQYETIDLGTRTGSPVSNQSYSLPEVGQNIQYFGDYEIINEIARGGMGVVYKARQVSLNRVVAIKMILAGQFANPDDVKRFYVEAKSAAKLDHPGIVPIYEIGEFSGQHFFSMKFIEGGSLSSQLPNLVGQQVQAIRLLVEVVKAVHHAHQRGILHRDLKPANILMDKDGTPFVTDLGLAKQVDDMSELTRSGSVMGTPNYMSPEQASGSKDMSTATDIYSLGAIMYELLTGKPPFASSSTLETLMKVVNDEAIKPTAIQSSVDRGLELICLKCLQKKPQDRYATANDLARDLQSWLAGEPLMVQTPSIVSVARRWMHQNFGNGPGLLVAGAFIGIAFGCLLWASSLQQAAIDLRNFNAKWPRVSRNDFILDFPVSQWVQTACIGLAVVVLATLGMLVYWIARPKNRSADALAGLIAGTIASIALYLCYMCFVPDFESVRDVEMLKKMILQIESKTPKPPIDLFAVYPDLAGRSQVQQLDFLTQKIELDGVFGSAKVAVRDWFLSFFCCIPSAIFGTLMTGHMLRTSKTNAIGILKAFEVSAAFCVIQILSFVALGLLVMLGNLGEFYSWFIAGTLFCAALSIYMTYNKVTVWARLPVQLIGVLLLLSVCTYELSRAGIVASHANKIHSLEKSLERQPQNKQYFDNLIQSERDLGYAFMNAGLPRDAEKQFARTEARITASPLLAPLIEQQIVYDRSWALNAMGQPREAIKLRKDLAKKNALWIATLFDLLRQNGSETEAQAWLGEYKLDSMDQWDRFCRACLAMLDNFSKKPHSDDVGRLEYITTLARNALEDSKTLTTEQKQELLKWVSNGQSWRLTYSNTQEIPDDLTVSQLPSLISESDSSSDAVQIQIPQGDLIVESKPNQSMLAVSKIEAPTESLCRLEVAANSDCHVWLNGIRVYDFVSVRGEAGFTTGSTQLKLVAGENVLVVWKRHADRFSGFRVQLQDNEWPCKLRWSTNMADHRQLDSEKK